MKNTSRSGLFVSLALVVVIEGFMHAGRAFAAAAPQTASGGAAQTPAATMQTGGIVIVPTLEKPKNASKLEEKDFTGYLLVYFKDQTQSAYMAVSRDGYTFTDLNGGRLNNMGFTRRRTSCITRIWDVSIKADGSKYGEVTYLTLDELKAIAEHWKVDIKLD